MAERLQMTDRVFIETTSAGSNLAVIKYWGKADRKLNTPINSSVSVALNQDDLCTVTTVAASKGFTHDRLWLNGAEEDITNNKRVQTVLREMRRLAQDREDADGSVAVRKHEWSDGTYHIHIVSHNNFPTAAGLASSAAGYACMTAALSHLFRCREAYPGELSCVARQGSGSACRSMYGGFVRWQKGEKADGSDSHAVQVAPPEHWPELQVLILVAGAEKKEVSSTSGMMTSVETSALLRHRAAELVEPKLRSIEDAYKRRDFAEFGRIAMADSNQFHATCLDTYPPIFYMNDSSKMIVMLVHKYNEAKGEVRAAYTFDAGPNAVIFVQKKDQAELLAFLLLALPPAAPSGPGAGARRAYVNDPELAQQAAAATPSLSPALRAEAERRRVAGRLEYIMHTTVGTGPRLLSASEALVDAATGLPHSDGRSDCKAAAPACRAAVLGFALLAAVSRVL